MKMRKIVLRVLLLASSGTATMGVFPVRADDAITCDHLKTALVAGASEHRLQTPVARSEQYSPSNPDHMAWRISFEGLDQPVLMMCHSGYVKAFAADNRDLNASEVLVMDIALTAWGFEPEEAAKIREVLITEAKRSRIAEVTAGRAKISFIISFAGAPSFQIDQSW
jgi:hypothetical protein